MRASCVGLISVLTLLFTHALARSEYFDGLIHPDLKRVAGWPYSPLKQVDLCSISWWDPMPVRKEVLEQQLADELLVTLERRCIITRRKGADTPTWDGEVPAFVFDPLLWYFDPDYPFGAAEAASDAFTDASDEIMHGFIISRMNFGYEMDDGWDNNCDSPFRVLPFGGGPNGYYARARANRRLLTLRAAHGGREAADPLPDYDDVNCELNASFLFTPPGMPIGKLEPVCRDGVILFGAAACRDESDGADGLPGTFCSCEKEILNRLAAGPRLNRLLARRMVPFLKRRGWGCEGYWVGWEDYLTAGTLSVVVGWCFNVEPAQTARPAPAGRLTLLDFLAEQRFRPRSSPEGVFTGHCYLYR